MELPFAVEATETVMATTSNAATADAAVSGVGGGVGSSSDGRPSGINSNRRHNNNSSSPSSSSSLDQSESSLVTASSQGSLVHSNEQHHHHQQPQQRQQQQQQQQQHPHHGHHHSNSPLPPNTPQDVVLPARYGSIGVVPSNAMAQHSRPQQQQQHHSHHRHHNQQQQQGQLVVTPQMSGIEDCGYDDDDDDEHAVVAGGGKDDDDDDDANHHSDDDFAYVNVTEMDADGLDDMDLLMMDGGECDVGGLAAPPTQEPPRRGDVLAVLLSGMQRGDGDALMNQAESANEAALRASEAKKQGDLLAALDFHTQAAKLYKDSALSIRDRNSSLAGSLLLLSQTQAKSAIALKGIVKLNPAELRQVLPPSSRGGDGPDTNASAAISHKERLRAAVRGALGSRHPHEADLSDSQFLGRAPADAGGAAAAAPAPGRRSNGRNDCSRADQEGGTLLTEGQESSPSSSSHGGSPSNPVDEMMELERELRDMDMALELGNSISSLDARMQNRMKSSMIGDGSFMVVPPGSQSYMSTSMWGSGHVPSSSRPTPPPAINHGTAGVRARANRVQNMLEASATPAAGRLAYPLQAAQLAPAAHGGSHRTAAGLESSWWGNASTTTSQILASSVVPVGGRTGADGGLSNDAASGGQQQPPSSTNTKQLMRLMDSLKTLGDENAVLLREVEELEAARAEAKAAREQMKRFKADYGTRFATLKKALDKFRQDHPGGGGNASSNPVSASDFIKSASVSDQIQRQEQLIRKLTADLKKEKEESKKKDAALRKYESFYREVKARSAQKAAQRQLGSQPQQQRQGTKARSTPSRPAQR